MKKVIWFYIGLTLILILVPILSVKFTGGIYIPENYDEIEVYITAEDRVEKMNTEKYLKEVTAAEMPAEFDSEALKAQVVAVRTYLRARIEKKEENRDAHKGAVVCTDFKHCAAWVSEAERKASWGEKGDEYWNKISDAVLKTKGEILTFNGKTISAVFHSTSSGKTESAKDVWGGEVSYLVSVDCPGDELSPKFYAEKQMSVEEFKNTILKKYPESDAGKSLFENDVRSEAGGIISVTVLGNTIKGTEFRSLFDLRSTNAEFIQEGETVLIKTKGYGHGVGMSQYGADFMAKQGKTYREILAHFYQGTEVKKTESA